MQECKNYDFEVLTPFGWSEFSHSWRRLLALGGGWRGNGGFAALCRDAATGEGRFWQAIDGNWLVERVFGMGPTKF